MFTCMSSEILVVGKRYGWQVSVASAKKQSKENGHIPSPFLL